MLDKSTEEIGVISLFPETCIVSFWEKQLWSFNFLYFFNSIQSSGIAFYVIYVHSRTMYVVPMERGWKDKSDHTKYLK